MCVVLFACDGASPACTAGTSVACTCASGVRGAAICGDEGSFEVCECETRGASCVPGRVEVCACDGSVGTRACDASHTFGDCRCDVGPTPACVPGTMELCSCTSGEHGGRLCDATGTFGDCRCGPGSDLCVPGTTRDCYCDGLIPSVLTCGDDGRYGDCQCDVFDGGPWDGGTDAAVAACDPHSGAACGCPEIVPPTSPALAAPAPGRIASGPDRLVGVAVTERGIVVALATGVRLLSRGGAMLASWAAPREIVAFAFDGQRVVAADDARVTTLDVDLIERGHISLPANCDSAALVSCGRLACATRDATEERFELYELDASRWVPQGRTYVEAPLLRVPGVDAVMSCGTFAYYVSVTDTRLVREIGWRPTTGNACGFFGSPAHHLVTATGDLYALDGCPNADATSSTCMASDGELGTLGAMERFLAFDRGEDGSLYALTSLRDDPAYRDTCSSGCAVQRIDETTRTIVSSGAFVTTVRNRLLSLRHDAWSGRVVIGGPRTCGVDLASCDGWAIWIAAYD